MRILAKDIDEVMSRLEKISPTLATLISPAITEVSNTIQFAQSAGVTMLGSHHTHFKDGVLVEVVRRNKHSDVLAAGGRWAASCHLQNVFLFHFSCKDTTT